MLTADLARGKLTNVSPPPAPAPAECRATNNEAPCRARARVAANQSPDIHIYTQWELQVISSIQRERDIERCVECVGSWLKNDPCAAGRYMTRELLTRCWRLHRSSSASAGASIEDYRGDFKSRRRPLLGFSWLKVPTSAFTFKTLLRHKGSFEALIYISIYLL